MNKFKVGDTVECVNNFAYELTLSKGEKYTVEGTDGYDFVKVLGRSWHNTRFKLVEENKMQKQFTKNDLKDWMRVTTRNGYMYIVNATKGICSRNGGHLIFEGIDHELKNFNGEEEWDIMGVYDQPENGNYSLDPFITGTLLWKREEKSPEQIEAENITKEIESLKLRLEELSKKI